MKTSNRHTQEGRLDSMRIDIIVLLALIILVISTPLLFRPQQTAPPSTPVASLRAPTARADHSEQHPRPSDPQPANRTISQLLQGDNDRRHVRVTGKPVMARKGNGYVVYALQDREGLWVHVLDLRNTEVGHSPRTVVGTYYHLMHTIIVQ